MDTITTNNLEVIRMTKGKLPRLPFASFKEKILGKKYSLTIVFATPAYIQNLNKQYRQKEYVPNVLAFPIEKNAGELYLSLGTIRKEAQKHDYTYEQFIAYLLIHGLLHLKGYDHGSTMDNEENKFKKFFNVTEKSKN